ncbi:MAG: hypothetical protein K2L42_02930 [Clostridia bacterium]|nr:hypothetical protein [Clostridia bacterium]
MDKRFSRLRMYLQKRRYKVKRIHKEWVGFGTGLKAVLKDLFIVFQLSLLVALYSAFVYYVPYAFYVCLGLTVLTAVYVGVFEKDIQAKISWILLFAASFGCGFIIYLLASKPVSYGWQRIRFAKIAKRVKLPETEAERENLYPAEKEAALALAAEREKTAAESYLNLNGFKTFSGTAGKYYANARAILDNLIARIDAAEKFVFMEFFIVADGVLLDRLVSIFRRKTAEGIPVYMLYDDVGSAGVFSDFMKDTLRAAGVKLKAFANLFSPFYFGLNFRDHKKIVVVDGKTGYAGGFNLIDDCANQRKMEGVWKDSGIRLDGAAVDGLSVAFMRQWELATREKLDPEKFLNNYSREEGLGHFVPYAGGPEIKPYICREVYAKIIDEAEEKLYIMTPYLVPDSGIMKKLIKKAGEGVDVRLVLPGVPDYRYIYRVTTSNARALMKRGIKIYYAGGEFVHSKVMQNEKCAAVGSVNLDMRAFYQEFDNGVLTDDESVMQGITEDFDWIFECNVPETRGKVNPIGALITLVLRIVSPLM